jgi:integrase
VAESRDLTVRVFARRWIDETLFYRSPAYVAQIVRWLDAYIDPAIGDMQLADVQPGDVLAIIKARADTPVSAERIRVIVQQFYNHAIRNRLVTTNPAQPLRGAIARAPVEHHRHSSEKEMGAFWRKLDDQGAHTTTIAATKLLMLTMTRKSELLRSKWPEFDLDAAQWDIPAERMKMPPGAAAAWWRSDSTRSRRFQALAGAPATASSAITFFISAPPAIMSSTASLLMSALA